MSYYDAKLVDISYKTKGTLPGNNLEANLVMTAVVHFSTTTRGLPGFIGESESNQLRDVYVIERAEDLGEKTNARIEELERKAELCIALKQALKQGALTIVAATPEAVEAKPPEDNDTQPDWPDGNAPVDLDAWEPLLGTEHTADTELSPAC